MNKMNEVMEPTNNELAALENEIVNYEEVSYETEEIGTEDSLSMYLKEISRYPLLTPEEEKALPLIIRKGGQEANDAKTRMVQANLKLVVYVAKHCTKNSSLDLMDVISMGNEGLMKAVDRFQPEKGFRFSTYAIYWIRQAISRGIANEGHTIRIPANNKEDKLSVCSLDANVSDEVDTTFGDMMVDENSPDPYHEAEQEGLSNSLDKALSILSKKESLVLKLRHGMVDGHCYTLDEIGKRNDFQVSRERVRQIERKALSKIRKNPRVIEDLREYIA